MIPNWKEGEADEAVGAEEAVAVAVAGAVAAEEVAAGEVEVEAEWVGVWEKRVYRPVAGGHGGGGGNEGDERVPLPPGCYVGPEFGGPHGDDFTDAFLVKSG
ncbi:hypothetical protein GN958_ATG13185 [Phytophthora infestans]|uniref:Uncharacterized protein n=1 Tax=Phytophthora infestans TaxID=4787 RepID=A0A8S9U9W4_PHYIN|nr:hypothetical protein GN958_ATG13185 [Phytophthora infestans]